MRMRRMKVTGEAVYHCMSRTVNGQALFGKREKEVLRKMIAQVADFSGVEVLTYCIMSNHFHVLVRILHNQNPSDGELMRRYRVLYPKPTKYQAASAALMESTLRSGSEEAEAIRKRLCARMGDISEFMKTLKQRFSTWFNNSHDRFGPLWADRFKSVLVEGSGYALQTMAAYIDLNPVRAGLVSDPKDYRFCGYAEAVAGNTKAIRAIAFVTLGLKACSNKTALQHYRQMLFGKGMDAVPGASNIDRRRAVKVIEEENGKLPAAVMLRCRVRYFSEGAILGSHEFVQSHAAHWQRIKRRKFPPRIHRFGAVDGDVHVLATLDNLRGTAFT